MKKCGAILGGEPSGHIILKHLLPTGDGMLAALFFLKALKHLGWSDLDVRGCLPVISPQTVNLSSPQKKPLPLESARRAEGGIAAQLGSRARLLIRYSGTDH